jgi:hypothetical protein
MSASRQVRNARKRWESHQRNHTAAEGCGFYRCATLVSLRERWHKTLDKAHPGRVERRKRRERLGLPIAVHQ